MSTLISTINMAVQTGEGLNSWAQVAGMTAEQFKTAWGQDAAGALNLFIQGLNNTERNGKSAESTLKDLGVTETRMTRDFPLQTQAIYSRGRWTQAKSVCG